MLSIKVNTSVLQIELCFPEEALVYDYRLDDAGVSNLEVDDGDEARKVKYSFPCRFLMQSNPPGACLLFSHCFSCALGPVGQLDE